MNILFLIVLGAGSVFGQDDAPPMKVFVGGFGSREGANELREMVMDRLGKSGRVTLVYNFLESDFILTGTGEVTKEKHSPHWEGGHPPYSNETRIVTNAFVSAELKTKDNKRIWAADVGPYPMFNRSVASSVAGRTAKKVLSAINKYGKKK